MPPGESAGYRDNASIQLPGNYGADYSTIDSDPEKKPDFIGDCQKTDFPDESFDIVLCNGMYEYVKDFSGSP
jgi:hypothetical protein